MVEPVIELAIIIALMLFAYRGGIRSGQPLWTPGKVIAKDDAVRLVLFTIIVLLLIGFSVNLLMVTEYPSARS
jgi:hypothetical protein